MNLESMIIYDCTAYLGITAECKVSQLLYAANYCYSKNMRGRLNSLYLRFQKLRQNPSVYMY